MRFEVVGPAADRLATELAYNRAGGEGRMSKAMRLATVLLVAMLAGCAIGPCDVAATYVERRREAIARCSQIPGCRVEYSAVSALVDDERTVARCEAESNPAPTGIGSSPRNSF